MSVWKKLYLTNRCCVATVFGSLGTCAVVREIPFDTEFRIEMENIYTRAISNRSIGLELLRPNSIQS